MSKISDERLAEMLAHAEAATETHLYERSADQLAILSELQSLRSQPAGVRVWDIEEFRIWRGLDPDKAQWASRGFACASWDKAKELVDFLEHNDATLILRVVSHECLSALEPQQEEAEPAVWIDPAALAELYAGSKHGYSTVYRSDEAAGLNTLDSETPIPLFAHPTPVQKVQESQTVSVTDEMVERAARAIAGTAYEGVYFTTRSREQYIDAEWHNHSTDARTALTAALEPSTPLGRIE